MSEPNVTRSPLTLAALATAAVPGLDVVATRPPHHPGADFDVTSLMDSSGRRWMVRAPKDAAAGAAMEGEVALLSALARAADDGALPFDVPRPAGFAALPEGGRAMVYRELLGRPLPLEALAAGPGLAARVGRAIARLHELPTEVVTDAGLPHYDAEGYRLRRLTEVDEAARTGYVPAGLLRRWEHALEDVRLWRFRETPVHGDLAAEHVLVADDEVVGIIDWSDARVADPADDLAWLLATAPEESIDAILESYALARTEHSDEHLTARALLASELAVARWLLHGVRHRDGGVIDDAVQMLRELDEAVADEPPIGYREPVVRLVPAPVPAEPERAAGEGHAGEGEPEQLAEARTGEEHFTDRAPKEYADPPAFDDVVRADADATDPARGATHARDGDPARRARPADGAEPPDSPVRDADAPDGPDAVAAWQEPDYQRTAPPRGHDDTPTTEIPPTRD